MIDETPPTKRGWFDPTINLGHVQRLLPEAVQSGEYLSVAYGNAALSAGYASLSSGFVKSVDWKVGDGVFVSLDKAAMEPIVAAVASHVPASIPAGVNPRRLAQPLVCIAAN